MLNSLPLDFPHVSEVNNPLVYQKIQVWSLGWEDPKRRKWQPTPIFLPGKSHGQRSLAGLQSMGMQRAGHSWVTEHIGSFGNAWGHFSVTPEGERVATSIWWVQVTDVGWHPTVHRTTHQGDWSSVDPPSVNRVNTEKPWNNNKFGVKAERCSSITCV